MQVLAPNGPALLRRLLLALATTLIVARPLVVGEDPGLTANFADPWGMVLTLLWLLAAIGWAAWRYWLRPASAARGLALQDAKPQAAHWYGGVVQAGLLATVVLVFVSAAWAAHYKFPAWLIAWEWFGLFVVFFVVRQLAVSPHEQHGLFVAVLSGTVSLAAQGIYQKIVEQPSRIHGPYAGPSSYAGFLLLGLPGLIGAVVICLRGHAPKWQTILTAGCAILGLAALGLAVGAGASGNPMAQRLQYWQTTWQMIGERPWLGVGPGNFGENYPRLMPETAEEKIAAAHNFALEMGATCGVFALLALLAALTAFFYRMVRQLRRAGGVSPLLGREQGADAPRSAEAPLIRWEFYLGGMFGLLLGFVLRVNTATPDAILAETYAAALRSVVWFAAFGLLERTIWTERGRALALTTGVAILLLNLCVNDGIGFPSLAGPMWIAVALALNSASLQPVSWLSRAGASMILPLPISIGVFVGYGVYVLYPILAADSLVREAAQIVAYVQRERDKPPSEQSSSIRANPAGILQKSVIGRLEQAKQLTPDDARIYVQLAWWNHAVWDMTPSKTQQELSRATDALGYGVMATRLDPQGAAGYWVQYRIRMRYAEINESNAEAVRKAHGDPLVLHARENTAREQCRLAAQTLEQYLPNDPHDANLHYALARAWFKAGEKKKGREQAEEARRLDNLRTSPRRKLTDQQRQQLQKWLPQPSDE